MKQCRPFATNLIEYSDQESKSITVDRGESHSRKRQKRLAHRMTKSSSNKTVTKVKMHRKLVSKQLKTPKREIIKIPPQHQHLLRTQLAKTSMATDIATVTIHSKDHKIRDTQENLLTLILILSQMIMRDVTSQKATQIYH